MASDSSPIASSANHWSVGSRWLRWEPHIHTPGTLLNDQFGDAWDEYIERIESAKPAPHALGITDYYSLRSYKEILRRKENGALANIPLVFPNVEIRLTVETKRRSGINLHLLVSPDDPEHVAKIEERLSRLVFEAAGDRYPCTDDGLLRLGRAHRNDNNLAEDAARSEGANQFKITFEQVRDELFKTDQWIRSNVLVGIAAGEDGLAGLAGQSSFKTLREELGRFANVVFSGQPTDRKYWLGHHDDFATNEQRPKPCLHGCDAHDLEHVLNPDEDRRCWVRAEPTFDGLRQTLVEPERRVHIGPEPPVSDNPGEVIRRVEIKNAPWLQNDVLELNDGLVTIIGAKGSGKTALAELIAFAADADDPQPGEASFIKKAGSLLDGIAIDLQWDDDSSSSATIPRAESEVPVPRVRYLSQQFVERLCAPGGLADPLVEQIEKVVFNAVPYEDQLQCNSFTELHDLRVADPVAEQEAARQAIQAITRQVAKELALEKSVPNLKANLQNEERDRKAIEEAIKALPIKASEEKVIAHQKVAADLQALKKAIAEEGRRTQSLGDLESDVKRQIREAEGSWSDFKAKYTSILSDEDWKLLQPDVPEQALSRLAELVNESEMKVVTLREKGLPVDTEQSSAEKSGLEAMNPQGLSALEAQLKTATEELGLDRANAKKRASLQTKLAAAKQKEQKTTQQLAYAKDACGRRAQLQAKRLEEYQRVFDALMAEEEKLKELYEPLSKQIEADTRLEKLSFAVKRIVDIDAWAKRGEQLLDLRKQPFQEQGAAGVAKVELLDSWMRGTPGEARAALKAFMDRHVSKAMAALKNDKTLVEFGEWLFSTDHISVRYAIEYEGVDVANLSPGTKGVVLLTLYLGLDRWDQRPLVIDQPEENLDPRSVHTDLVPFFRDAARRRQIIMVTHNANLVVNADSDQVIVANALRESPKNLPTIEYVSGGLENTVIRSAVCELLEGGEDAFIKRGQRYGIRIDQLVP